MTQQHASQAFTDLQDGIGDHHLGHGAIWVPVDIRGRARNAAWVLEHCHRFDTGDFRVVVGVDA